MVVIKEKKILKKMAISFYGNPWEFLFLVYKRVANNSAFHLTFHCDYIYIYMVNDSTSV